MQKLGKTGPDSPPTDGTRTWVDKTTGEAHEVSEGIDPGWDYAPGASLSDQARRHIEGKAATLPPEIGAKLAKVAATSRPAAPPVSLALRLPKTGPLADLAKETMQAIDAIHGDGALPTIPMVGGAGKGYNGALRVMPDGTAVDIRIAPRGPHPALTMAHEIGHFIDHQAIGTVGKFSYTDPIWDGFLKAAGESNAIKELFREPKSKYRDYYLQTWEIWARAYAQWIAKKSGRKDMSVALNTIRGDRDPLYRNTQWDARDFEPIAAAIEGMFTQLGWL